MSGAKNPLFIDHCAAIHAKGMSITPYRLGQQVGERGENFACPYTNRKSVLNYLNGVKVGRRVRQEKQAADNAATQQTMTTTNSTTEAEVTDALKLALAYVRWQAFGECRTADHDGPPPSAAELDTALVAALAQSRQPSATNAPKAGSLVGDAERQPLTTEEIADLTAMIWGAPVADNDLRLAEFVIRAYEALKPGERPKDPANGGRFIEVPGAFGDGT